MEKFTKIPRTESDSQDSGFLSGNISGIQSSSASSAYSALSVASIPDIGADSGINLESPTALSWEQIYAQDPVGDTALHRILTLSKEAKDENWRQAFLQMLRAAPTPDLLEITNDWGQTALHVACEHEDSWSARRLILAGATVDRLDDLRFSPLHIAAQKANAGLVEAIVKPITPEELSEVGLRHYAVTPAAPRTQLPELSQLCSVGMSPLHLAVKAGNLVVLEELLPFAGNLDTRELLQGRTALQFALDLHRSDMVKALLEAGASTEQEDYAGRTALERLLLSKRVMVEEELRHEADACILLLRASGAMEPDEEDLAEENEVDEEDRPISGIGAHCQRVCPVGN